MRRYFLSCRTPGALALPLQAPSQDRQPAEVRFIWGYDSEDKAIIFLLLYHREESYFVQASQASPHLLVGDMVARKEAGKAEAQGPASVAESGEVHTGTFPPCLPCPNVPHSSVEWTQLQHDWSIYDSPSLSMSLFSEILKQP